MKKITFVLGVLLSTISGFASGWEATVGYRGSSKFYQGAASIERQMGLSYFAGLEARYTDEDALKDPVYSVYLPLRLESNLWKLTLTPFYYFKNKSHDAALQDAYAYGISGRFIMTLQEDLTEDLYTHAYLGVSFARQKGTLFLENGDVSNQYYSQMAYTLGLHKNFFHSFSFEVFANAYQYPNGITGVESFRGILDQWDLVQSPSLDLSHELGKYHVGGQLTRLWVERRASLYLGYRFGEFYSTDPEHSFLLGNTFAVTNTIQADAAYNHLRTIHNERKRDVFYVKLKFSF